MTPMDAMLDRPTPAPWRPTPVYSQDGRPTGNTAIMGGPDGLSLAVVWTGTRRKPTPMADVRLMCAAPLMLAELRRLEWGEPHLGCYGVTWQECPVCRGIWASGEGVGRFEKMLRSELGHKPDCTLAAAILKATGDID